ncbi:hypothetical protein CsatB_022590 [Cannabis sativa]
MNDKGSFKNLGTQGLNPDKGHGGLPTTGRSVVASIFDGNILSLAEQHPWLEREIWGLGVGGWGLEI